MRSTYLLAFALAFGHPVAGAPLKEGLPAGAIARLDSVGKAASADDPLAGVNAIAFLQPSTLFVGTGTGWSTWDVVKRARMQEQWIAVPAFAALRQGDRLHIGSAGKLVALEPISSRNTEPTRTWESGAESVGLLATTPNGGRIVFSHGEKTLAVLETHTGKITGIAEFASRPLAASLTANGRILGLVTHDGAARIYSLSATGLLEQLWAKRVTRSAHPSIEFSPDGRLVAVAAAGRVQVLDAVTGRPMQVLERQFGEGDVRCLTFSPDGRQYAVGSNGPNGLVRIADIATGSEQIRFSGHTGDVRALAFAPDGRTLASAGAESTVFLWKVPVPNPGPGMITTVEAWDTLDALDADVAYRAMGCLLAHPGRAVDVIRNGFLGVAEEQVRIRRWVAELDHDEFRVREAARRSITRTGLRGAAILRDPGRKKMGLEGENRVRLILESFEAQGLRIPESGYFGESLRSIRAVRILETIGGKEARSVLERVARGSSGLLAKEAGLALQTFPDNAR